MGGGDNFIDKSVDLMSHDVFFRLFARKKIKEAFGYIKGGMELNPVRISFPSLGAQQTTAMMGQSPDDPVRSRARGLIYSQESSNTGHLNAIMPNPYSFNALPTVQI